MTRIAVEGTIQDANLVYDALRRLHQVTTDTYTKAYTYRDISDTRTTTQITGLSYTGLFNHTFGYTYDALGYIETYSPKAGETIQYDYDAQGQLTSVTVGDQKTIYTYDSVGNILSVKQGDASANPATYSTVGSYTYGNSSWRDLLTKYNGGAIAYEGQTYNAETNTVTGDPISGNPISYFNGTRWTFDWENGRQLVSASTTVGNTDIDIAYTYDFDGLRTGKTVTYTTTEEEEHTHEYTETVVEATCTEDGYTIFTCSCGDSYLDDIVDALGHNYVESATETGTVFTCTRCGDSYTGHTHSYTETVTAPTCTESGYTTYTCSCGNSYTGNTVAALGHNYVQSGDVYTCSRCGDSYSGHQHTYTETITEPTCEQDGYTTYTCACGYSYTDNVVPALGHDYVLAGQDETIWTYACTRCGLSYTVVAPIVPEPPIEEYGLRRSRVSVVTEHHEYVYASGTLLRETITATDEEGNVTTETLDFVYDLNGSPYALNYTNGTNTTQTYYYITNVQGDVTHLVTADGEVVAAYGYDAWGKVTAATGSMAEVNPLRYRGYYYDAEMEFYYLQSRYYDPSICRFINADSYTSTGQSFLGYNTFIYCLNNPVMGYDPTGYLGLFGKIAITVGFVALCLTGVGAIAAATAAIAGAAATAVTAAAVTSIAAAGVSTAVAAVDGAICAEKSGGNWYDGAMAGAIGGSFGALVSKIGNPATGTDFALRMDCLGRAASSLVYDVVYDKFSGNEITSESIATYAVDVITDTIISPVVYGNAGGIITGGIVDGAIDVFQTVIFSQ